VSGRSETGENDSQSLVLVCFALKAESAPFRRIARAFDNVAMLITGIGRQNAERSVRQVLAARKPARVFTCGFAGALTSDLPVGSVIFDTDDSGLEGRLTAAGARRVKFHCADRIATTAQEKKALYKSTNADAVEMESGSIAAICREYHLPCATVRAISDAVDDDLPLDFNRLSKPDRSLDYGKLAWAIARSPHKIGKLMRLQKNAAFSAQKLAGVLAKVIFP
jgi:nucleoside phosphorylase